MKKIKDFISKNVPKKSAVIYCIFLFGVIIALISRFCTPFADFWNENIGAIFRGAFAYATGWLPFSLAEYVLLCVPVIFIALAVYIWKYDSQSVSTARYLFGVFSVPALVFAILLINFTSGYYATPIDEKLGMDKQPVSAEELAYTANILLANANKEAENIARGANGFTVMPYTLAELDDKINQAYKTVCEEHDFIQKLNTSVKPVLLSKPWTYTHIAGVYTFFTGEANINTNFPDYTLPFTVAHEMAHQRGISREEEANFVAFLVCISSDDAYIRYSGYLSVYEYVASALYSANEEAYFAVLQNMSAKVKGELVSFSEFFDEYRDSTASQVVESVQDAYLQQQGQVQGSRSYDLVTDLAVAYYKKTA